MKDNEGKPSRVDELKMELAATLRYGDEVAEKLDDATLGDAVRKDYEDELEAVEIKASELREQIKAQEKIDARNLRIRNLGREVGVQSPTEEPVQFRSPVDALFADEKFQEVLSMPASRRGQVGWSAEVEAPFTFQAVATDPTTANPDTAHVQHMLPGIVAPFVYPQRVGQLFTQGTMEGSRASWLFIPGATASGAADYATYAAKKLGPGTITVDSDEVKAAKIATWFLVPDDALDDLAQLRSNIENLLLVGPSGISVKAESEYINGGGGSSPPELVGVATLSPDPVTTGENLAEAIIAAALDIEAETGFAANGVVVNPSDYFTLVTLKAADGRPLFSPFGGAYGPPAGLPPVVRSRAVAPGTIFVGAFQASRLLTREAVNIRSTNMGLGLMDYNRTLFVAETRQALVHQYGKAVYREITISTFTGS